ncbi:MAG: diguanylate cyclase [Acidobacteria bacterium]|nr:diguanylate cyclase [Acidobacteriota bacterium]
MTKLFCALILLHAGLRLAFGGGVDQLSHLVLILIGGVWLLPKWKEWFCVLALPIQLAWVGTSAIRLPQSDQRWGAIELALATIGIGVALWIRNRIPHPEAVVVAAESETEQVRKRMLAAADGSNDGLWYWSIATGEFTVNAAWARLLAYKPGEIKDDIEEWWSRVHPGYLEQLRADVDTHLKGGGAMFSNVHRILRKDGTYLWVSARGNAVRNETGRAIALAGSLRDMTSVIDADRNSKHDSFHDKLTGLPNRGFLMARLNRLTANQTSATHPTGLFALLFLDLDRFKTINDTLGHLAGDQLLLSVADRLRNCVRPMDMVSRFAGDEFAVLLEQVTDTDEALRIALRIRDSLGHPYDLSGREVLSGASVGVVMGRDRSATADELGATVRRQYASGELARDRLEKRLGQSAWRGPVAGALSARRRSGDRPDYGCRSARPLAADS